MSSDEEKQYGEPEILSATPPRRPMRPLTAEEKLEQTTHTGRYVDSTGSSEPEPQEQLYNGQVVSEGNGILSRLRSFEAALDRKLGIESEAIDRKLPEDRAKPTWHGQLNMALLWASGTMNLSCFATGFLGHEFGLSLKQSILIIIFGSILGGAVSGFTATFGAPTGLRQISAGRYGMGWYPNKIAAALNTIQQLGWSATGCITGGIALQAVSNGRVSIAVGIVIIAVVSLLVSTLGLKAILVYEKYAWFIYLVIFLIIFGETGRYADNISPPKLKGPQLSGGVLNLLAVVYGSSASWCTLASDYYVHYPVNVNRYKVFFMTTFGIALPTSIGMVAGAVVSSALNNQDQWAEVYKDQGIGFLIQTMLYPIGFAKFLLVLLVLSGINLNIINTYSAAISCQQFARPLALIPRFVWTILCFGVIIAISLAGKDNLLTYLEDFLSLLGYWCTSYFVIVCSEHFIFRKGDFNNYDLEGWNDPARMPVGFAAMAAFSLGVVAWVMGMAETWYTGPLAALIGGGGDVANEFTLVVTFLTFVPARYLELKYIGR